MLSLVFKARVIEALEQKRQPIEEADSETDDSSAEESESLTVTVTNQQDKTEILEPPAPSELSFHKLHEDFMKKQVTLAAQYLEKKRQLPTVSSKQSVEEDPCPAAKRPYLEGRGPRTVPSAVKNRRRKMKKKRAKERAYAAAHGKQEWWCKSILEPVMLRKTLCC